FGDAIRSWVAQLGESKVELRTGRAATAGDLVAFDAVVLASGIRPRAATIPGIESPLVMGYLDYLSGRRKADKNVVVIGGGGIAFDVALALVEEGSRGHLDPTVFARHWGIDFGYAKRGGLGEAEETKAPRKVTILQRTPGKGGKRLGRSTGWIHRLTLQRQGVEVLGGVRYDRVDGSGIHVEVDGRARFIAADTIIVCAGQEPMDQLARELAAKGRPFVTIGGAREAANLDAKRAIEEGLRAGLAI
ncbi:MAG: NADPH-dependent 2,4-dienoyl-CoA reductase, partial [Alphaproteobacteria bacterium]|nr:NADPH-dependent 2,4-dienoyl-CoA reductase [Alphaproteobacteria bacterium]